MILRRMLSIPKLSLRFVTTMPSTQVAPSRIPSFYEYKFIPSIYAALDAKELYTPTPIQELVIPSLMKAENLFFTAQNGTGKTFAYALPLINHLKRREEAGKLVERPRALIVVPSRELAIQTKDVLKEFAHTVKFRVTAFFGGEKLSIEQKALEKGLDIVVSTPERLDMLRKKAKFFIGDIEHLVIDEFDTLIDSGYKDTLDVYVQKVLKNSPKQKQLVLLSSTHPKQVENALNDIEKQHNFSFKRIIDSKTHINLANLEHFFEEVKGMDKFPFLLKNLKKIPKNSYTIVFCNSIKCAQAVEHFIREHKFSSTLLHGGIPYMQRQHNYLKFKMQDASVLVATDLAARGLDFPFVTHVINFDFPETESDYLHRAGRTGRADKKGVVITLYNNRNKASIDNLTKAFNTGAALNVKTSTYSKINKEDIKRNPSLLLEGKKLRNKTIEVENVREEKERVAHYKLKKKEEPKRSNSKAKTKEKLAKYKEKDKKAKRTQSSRFKKRTFIDEMKKKALKGRRASVRNMTRK
eukprot:TRINITY_DN11369_c0_g1_i3.p1 TRINITY_DN11369_c0_g1~~TRINITY_DN11369_c0_g1_i3.p1  ORF type:complete len:524 (-),score=111.18 TRINITY_DN11369_c0_g1_i3:177-1748(-)